MSKYLVFITAVVLSCSKNDQKTISGQVMHHDEPIPDAQVFIKFNSSVFPGNDSTQYDISTNADPGGNYELMNVTEGSHYLYARGWDPGLTDSVFGGIPFNVKKNKSDFETDIPVTE